MDFIRWSKLHAHVLFRRMKDSLSNVKFCKSNRNVELPYFLEITQPFTHSSTLEQKKINLTISGERIRNYIIHPGETFSFWRCVGNPNKKEFASSRGIRDGVLQLERGGGLCQASGIIHHLSLISGLNITERYNHSKDLYTEATRFCPLGSDATVAYGYRDLRVKNSSDASIQFDLEVLDDHFTGYLRSSKPLKQHDISFEYKESPDGKITAITYDKTTDTVIATSYYEKYEEIS